MEVVLEYFELIKASQVGMLRHVQDLKKGYKDAYGAQAKDGWQLDIEGALGECAVAKAFDIYWNGAVGKLSAPDVGKLQVRTTHHMDGRLILHDKDKDEDIFILVTGVNGKYILRGWISGKHGKDALYLSDPTKKGRQAYFVPQDVLNSMDFLFTPVMESEIKW